MNLVLLGPPGSGKSTVATPLIEQFDLALIATGQRLRDEIEARTPLGLEVEPYLERGELAPDAVMERLVRLTLAKIAPGSGFLLDGYPRTEHQALALETVLASLGRTLDMVIMLEIDDEEVVERLSGRRMCELPGETPLPMHTANHAAIADCTARGGTLTQREDDQPAVVRQRLAVYHESTAPLITFYRQRGLLRVLDASGQAKHVIARAEAVIHSLR